MRPQQSPRKRRDDGRPRSRSGPAVATSPGEKTVLFALAVVFAASGLLWSAGGLGIVLEGRGFHEVTPAAAPLLVVGAVEHPLSLRQAWPPEMRPLLPGEVALLAILFVILAAGVAAAWFVRGRLSPRVAGRAGRSGARRRHVGGPAPAQHDRSASWARPGELKPLLVPRPTPGRLTLGRSGRRLVATEARQSVLVVGPTQSYKTSGFAVPAILEWDGPVVATSVKSDLVRDTVARRREMGEVLVYDPAQVTGEAGAGWSPLASSRNWAGARRTAASLCDVAKSRAGGLDDAGFWYATAEKLLAPLLFAAATIGASMTDVVRWVDTEETSEVETALELAGVPAASRAARASFGREDRQRSSVFATAETVLEAYADPAIAASALRHDIDPTVVLDGGRSTVYLCAPAHEQERLQSVFVALVRELLEAAFERSARLGSPLDPPLLIVLDEAANIAPLSDLDRLASTGAGHGVQLVSVWQDLSQISARYGHRAATVVNNHRAKVIAALSLPASIRRAPCSGCESTGHERTVRATNSNCSWHVPGTPQTSDCASCATTPPARRAR